jgi:hypothetical protein
MRVTAPLSHHRGGEQVEHMMEQGMPFAQVEGAIDNASLSREHKAALWLRLVAAPPTATAPGGSVDAGASTVPAAGAARDGRRARSLSAAGRVALR